MREGAGWLAEDDASLLWLCLAMQDTCSNAEQDTCLGTLGCTGVAILCRKTKRNGITKQENQCETTRVETVTKLTKKNLVPVGAAAAGGVASEEEDCTVPSSVQSLKHSVHQVASRNGK